MSRHRARQKVIQSRKHAEANGAFVDRIVSIDYQLAQATIQAQEQALKEYERVFGQLAELLGTLAGCQSLEEIHTTLAAAMESGLLPNGETTK